MDSPMLMTITTNGMAIKDEEKKESESKSEKCKSDVADPQMKLKKNKKTNLDEEEEEDDDDFFQRDRIIDTIDMTVEEAESLYKCIVNSSDESCRFVQEGVVEWTVDYYKIDKIEWEDN